MRLNARATLAMFVGALSSLSVSAQLAAADPDWKEAALPAPPALRTERLIPLEIQGSELTTGVMPESVSVGTDGVVRYVVIGTSASGAMNATYEGVRCSTGEVRIYARHQPGGGWRMLNDDSWRPLLGRGTPRHSAAAARQGMCMGNGVNRDAATIVRDMRSLPITRFNNESR